MDERVKRGDESKAGAVKGWFGDIKGEFKKVVWPSGRELFKQTVTVIITSALIGAVIVGLDAVFAVGHQLLLKLAG